MQLIGWILLALPAVWIIVLAVNTAHFKPKKEVPAEDIPAGIAPEKIAADLQALIRCRTVSCADKAHEDGAEFDRLVSLLPGMFPNVHRVCSFEQPGPRSLLFHWKGQSGERPLVLMAHYDVVPARQADWTKPAFDGIIEDGVLWGRGTLDTKGTFVSVLAAADELIAQGFTPAHDIFLAFAGDEEIAGGGAPANIRRLTELGVKPYMVVDEGGAVVEGVFPGVKRPCAVIGTGEKGQSEILFRAKAKAGHASTPPKHTAVGILAQAVRRVEAKPFPFTLTMPAAGMFDTLARHSSILPVRVLFANLWCFRPLLDLACKLLGGEMNALVRTTAPFTELSGSEAFNVLPAEAVAGANVRAISGTTDDAVDYLRRVIRDERVTVEKGYVMDPCRVSEAAGEPWKRLSRAVRATWQDAIVSPYMMLAGSDARHYAAICDHVYRFCPMALSKEERRMIHGADERIPVATLAKTEAFYERLILLS